MTDHLEVPADVLREAEEKMRRLERDDAWQAMIRLDQQRWSLLQVDGWVQRRGGVDGLGCWDNANRGLRLIHSIARESDGQLWAHLSMSRRDHKLPTWEQTRDAWRLVYPQEMGYIVIAPAAEHYSIREVMHVWGCRTRRATPDFRSRAGTI